MSKRTMRNLSPLSLIVVALVALAWLVPSHGSSTAYAVSISAKEAHDLKAQLRKGGDFDATDTNQANERPNTNNEGSPKSAEDQFFQERAYPQTDVPPDGYPNALNEYQFMHEYSLSLGWRELGPLSTPNGSTWGIGKPSTISGRATAIAVVPSTCSNNSCSTIYLGTANGGVYKTTNGGATWSEIFDHQTTESVGSLTLDPKNSSIIYVGTGEPNSSQDSNRGSGLYKSIDGGIHWTQMGYNNFVNRSIANVVVDRNNSSDLYVASFRGQSGGSDTASGCGNCIPYLPPTGFYRSTDGGQTWTLSNPTPTLTTVYGRNGGISLVQSSAGTLYLGVWGQGEYKSTDGGLTWTNISVSSEATGTFDRVTLAVAPSNASVLYAGFSHTMPTTSGAPFSFYQSTNGGSSWTKMPNTPNACASQCWYDMPIAVDQTNTNTVYVGGMFNYGGCPSAAPYPVSCNSVIMKSTDGGNTWQDLTGNPNSQDVHPDDHTILLPPSGGLYTGNDGGLYHSTDAGNTWTSLNNGIGSLQYQSVSVSPNLAVYGGTQDNGTWKMPYNSTAGTHVLGGDGGDSMADPNNNNTVFDENYGATMQRYNDANGSQTWVASFYCDFFCFGRGQFYEPMAMGNKTTSGASASNDIFSGTYRLWRSMIGGGTDGNGDGDATNDPSDTTDWTPITPDMGSNITAIAVAQNNPNVVTIGLANGQVWYTNNALSPVTTDSSCNPFDGTNPNNTAYDTSSFCNYVSGINWSRLDVTSGGAEQLPNRYVSSMTFAPNSTTTIWVTYNGFSENTPSTPGHVFMTSNASLTGATWTNMDGTQSTYSIPDVPANSIVIKPNGKIFVAADYGVFMSANNGSTWYREDYALANAPVYKLTLSPGSGNQIYAATHGRGIWMAGTP